MLLGPGKLYIYGLRNCALTPLRNLNYTLKTGIPIEEGDCILKLLRRVSRPEIQLGVAFH